VHCERGGGPEADPQEGRGSPNDATLSVAGRTLGAMPDMRGEEQWVGACIEAALAGVKVEQHDDGSRPSMYDLDLMRGGEPFGACEVTAAADAESIELWNIINGGDERWIAPNLLGGWMVTVTPRCRAKRLMRELPRILRTMERVEAGPEREDAIERLFGLEIAHRSGTDFPGSIYVTLQRSSELIGGAVESTGRGLVTWLDEWIREPAQEHNLEKFAFGSASRAASVRPVPRLHDRAVRRLGPADANRCRAARCRPDPPGRHHRRLGHEHVVFR